MSDALPILVAACGNALAGDDAFGCAVAQRLKTPPLPGVEVVELGMAPAGLLDALGEKRGALIVVDAAQVPGEKAGRVLEWGWDDPGRPALVGQEALSTHGLGIAEQIELARRVGMLPPVVRAIVAVIGLAGVGEGLSKGMEDAVQDAAEAIRRFVAGYAGVPTSSSSSRSRTPMR